MKGTAAPVFVMVIVVVLVTGAVVGGQTEPTTPVPPVTDADRAAAFPDVEPHPIGDSAVYTFVLLDQLEWQGDATTRVPSAHPI